MITLKTTRSVCPVCLSNISATVVEKNNKVYMQKECPQHGKFEGLVERDVEFYKKTILNHSVKRYFYDNLLIPFSHKCNLNCNFCWLPQRKRKDFSIRYLKEVISKSKCSVVRICGGEPTIRNDLCNLIKFIKMKGKLPVIVTNGLKLADLEYVKKLKKAGLYSVCFSFNSFDDAVYKKLNGSKLLQIKLKALENLKIVGIRTALNVLIVKGVNDKDLEKIFDFCIKNNSFIEDLRIRGATPIGKFAESKSFFVSDLISDFSKILKVHKNEFIKNTDNKKHIVCKLTLLLISYKKNNFIQPWIIMKSPTFFNRRIYYNKFFIGAYVSLKLIKNFNFNTLFNLILNEIRGSGNLSLELAFRSWPNKYNIDLEEMNKCPTSQLSKNGEFSFCYSLILNDEDIIEL
jgi:uncharacterized radical SAM superfamily Fe-S cluster-containing enzyme